MHHLPETVGISNTIPIKGGWVRQMWWTSNIEKSSVGSLFSCIAFGSPRIVSIDQHILTPASWLTSCKTGQWCILCQASCQRNLRSDSVCDWKTMTRIPINLKYVMLNCSMAHWSSTFSHISNYREMFL